MSTDGEARPTGSLEIRRATLDDLTAIIVLLADDDLGGDRELPDPAAAGDYRRAFQEIDNDPRSQLLVADLAGVIVGTLQLDFLRYLTYRGGERAQIEAVRIARDRRGQGLGQELVRAAVAEARERGCHVVQLTTDKRRLDALSFYEGLGFVATHLGLKLHLEPPGSMISTQ